MRKNLIAFAIATASAGIASAQSNVTVYGLLDVGYKFTDIANQKSQNSIDSGILSTSRIGFKGVEDLGNNLKAIFLLEYKLNLDTNEGIGVEGGKGAARNQYVGLSSSYGEIRGGYLQTAGYDFGIATLPLGGSSNLGAYKAASSGKHLTNADRAANAVAYESPSFGGVKISINHARITEDAGKTGVGFGTGKDSTANLVAAKYAEGALNATLIYAKDSNDQTSASDNTKEWGGRAAYDFGVAKLQGYYQQFKDDSKAAGSDKSWGVGVSAPLGGNTSLIGEFSSLKKGTTAASDDRKAYTLAALYSLSKRTTAYAAFRATTIDNGNDEKVVGVGLRHTF